jgi:hypothetical protein
MSFYSNIEIILDAVDTGNQEALAQLIVDNDPEQLATDLSYVITSLFAYLSPVEKRRVKNKLISAAADFDFREIMEQGELDFE